MEDFGYLYVLEHEYMPGLIKVGYTQRKPYERVRELSASTSVPGRFTLVASYYCQRPRATESAIHRILSAARVPGREFFKIDISHGLEVIENYFRGQELVSSNSQHEFTAARRRPLNYRSPAHEWKVFLDQCGITYIPQYLIELGDVELMLDFYLPETGYALLAQEAEACLTETEREALVLALRDEQHPLYNRFFLLRPFAPALEADYQSEMWIKDHALVKIGDNWVSRYYSYPSFMKRPLLALKQTFVVPIPSDYLIQYCYLCERHAPSNAEILYAKCPHCEHRRTDEKLAILKRKKLSYLCRKPVYPKDAMFATMAALNQAKLSLGNNDSQALEQNPHWPSGKIVDHGQKEENAA